MVTMNRRALLGAPLYAALAAKAGTYQLPISSGPFQPTADSLKTYQAPAWFRDAKFGIWSHWGPQAVPRRGDWYARWMYVPGHSALRASPEALRTSFRVRVQGHHSVVEGGEVRSGSLDGPLCRRRREIFRQHGRASRQFRLVELDASSLERAGDGSQAGYRRCVARCGAPSWPALRRVRASRRQPQLVLAEPPVRSVLAQVRRRL